MRILITGGRGQLGRSLQRAFGAQEVWAPGREDLDVTDGPSIAAAFERHRPEVVIHAAALTDTVACERDPSAARTVNGLGAEHVARACQRAGARLVAVSTNEVFDGAERSPYEENHHTAPLNAYAISKLDGEWFATAACPDTLIARTAWLYGDGGNNFVEKVRKAAVSGRTLSFVTDEVATPTSTDDLAEAIRRLVEIRASAGIYHLTNGGEASRFAWASAILRATGFGDLHIQPVTMEALRATGYSGPRKPPYSVLANIRARALGIEMRPWEDALAAYVGRVQATSDA